MLNFTYYNPTRIVFGKGTIAELETFVPRDAKVLLLYGGGSVRRNGVYDQVRRALARHTLVEQGGVEANPHYETCLQAVATVRAEKVDFLLAVGGGSVIDAAKFIAAAAVYPGEEPWDLIRDWSLLRRALALGTVLTLPGTGSEMNGGAVISRQSTREKLYFVSEHTFPRFSILDPETTYTLPPRQFANGTIDAFVQVLEQYLTYDVERAASGPLRRGHLADDLAGGPQGASRSAELRGPGEPHVVRHQRPERGHRLRRAAGLDLARHRPRADRAVWCGPRPIAGPGDAAGDAAPTGPQAGQAFAICPAPFWA